MDSNSKPQTCREVLDVIGNFLEFGPEQEGHNLWMVLTALRGPDTCLGTHLTKDEIKQVTTKLVRYAAFGYDAVNRTGAFVTRYDDNFGAEIRKGLQGVRDAYHFYCHNEEAFNVLGLKWDENNECISESPD